jgi:O-methyltransferase
MFRILKKTWQALLPLDGQRLLVNRLSQARSFSRAEEEEVFEAIQLVKYNTMLPYDELASLYEQVVYCERNAIEGALVECGVWKGGAAGLMALASLRSGQQTRPVFLFDAFDDICEPNSLFDEDKILGEIKHMQRLDVDKFDGMLRPLSGIYSKWGGHGTIEECKRLFNDVIRYPSEHVHCVKGWFQETVKTEAKCMPKIAVLRLDGDWYDSTRVCLEALYPLLNVGGICIIDDYGYNAGCKKAVDDYLHSIGSFPLMSKIGNLRYWIKTQNDNGKLG